MAKWCLCFSIHSLDLSWLFFQGASFNFMAAVSIQWFWSQIKINSVTVSIISPSIFHEVMGLDAMILVYECWGFFKPAISLSSFIFIKRFLSSFLLSSIRVVSSAYLRLLWFLSAILIPVCNSSSLSFHMMYSAYTLNKSRDNMQPWCIQIPILNQSAVPCPDLTVASWSTHRFIRRLVNWPRIPVSLRIFHNLLWPIQSTSLVYSEAEVFLEFPCFFFF